jgi:hypothetical protein
MLTARTSMGRDLPTLSQSSFILTTMASPATRFTQLSHGGRRTGAHSLYIYAAKTPRSKISVKNYMSAKARYPLCNVHMTLMRWSAATAYSATTKRPVVKPLINIGNARISAESVKKVNEITTRLGNDIIKKD